MNVGLILRSSVLLLSILLTAVSCKEDEKPEFDRAGMLANMADNLIIPDYTSLNSSLNLFYTKASEFTANPDLTTLAALRSQYVLTNNYYQKCSMYNFGPAMEQGIKAAFNTFPTDTAQIEVNVASGIYNLFSVVNADAIGFPAIDYLLYFGSDAEIIADFSTNPNAGLRKLYLTDLVSKMKNEFLPVLNQWNDSYRSTFILANGNDVASSCSYLLNEFVKDVELTKNARYGIPSGQQTGGATLPAYVEAYYSGLSNDFAFANLTALKNCFNGGSGLGFDDYIKDVEDEDVTESLADKINSQFDVCINQINNLADPLSNTIETDVQSVSTLYLELKKLIVYLKTDMTSMLGILITYQDNDGD